MKRGDCTCAGAAPGYPMHEWFCGLPEPEGDCTCGGRPDEIGGADHRPGCEALDQAQRLYDEAGTAIAALVRRATSAEADLAAERARHETTRARVLAVEIALDEIDPGNGACAGAF